MTKLNGNQVHQNKEVWSRLFWGFLFVIGILCIWRTQRAVPLMMDDEWYSTMLMDETPLQSFADVVKAQIWHYQNWGGRTVAHTIDQLILLCLKEQVADILNVSVIVLLSWMLSAISGNKSLAYVTVAIGMLHGLNANWKMSMYWQTGACNYLYTTVIILAFLWMYLKALDSSGGSSGASAMRASAATGVSAAGSVSCASVTKFLLAVVLGLLCGWTNENMGPAVWMITLLVMHLLHREGRAIKAWMVGGSITCLLGSILMIAAPGNAVRSAQVVSNQYGTLWQAFLRGYSVCTGVWSYLFAAILLAMIAVAVNVLLLGNPFGKRDLCLLMGALLSWGAMILSPHYPDRAAFGTMCFLICVILSQASSILKNKDTRGMRFALSGIGVFIWLKGMYGLGEFLAICWGWIR